MREITFRAWIERKNSELEFRKDIKGHMSDPFYFYDFDADYYVPEGCYLEDMKIMQYIGLKDKNDKEIYEGDLLKNENGDILEVDDAILGEFIYIYYHEMGENYIKENCEVIGNIYENPELIEPKHG
ncbi:MAG TPA: YopX family protein [Clostridia bacterium]